MAIMKNKLRWLILLTPILLFAVVTMLGNRDRTPINTPKLQAILSRADYVSVFNARTALTDTTITQAEQTFYQGKSANRFAKHFRLSDSPPDKNTQPNSVNSYHCDFMDSNKEGSASQVAYIIVSFDSVSKEHYARIKAPAMNGLFVLEESAARDLSEIFAAHDARMNKLSAQ